MFFTVMLAGACGGESDGDDGPDGGNSDEWQPLVTLDWALEAPGGAEEPEGYVCKTYTVPEDMIITGFRTIAPPGTHHAVLSVGEVDREDSEFNCYFADGKEIGLVGSGYGSDDFNLPEGVGLQISAGQQLFLNLHVFNASDGELTGTSGIAIKTAETVETLAENTAAAAVSLDIEPGTGQTQETTCTIKEEGTIVYWWPHMHQLGRRMTVRLNDQVVLDEPYSFTEQVYYPGETAIHAGDTLTITCTYDNDTGETVHFGESTNDEMCLLAFWRYPATGEAYCDLPF